MSQGHSPSSPLFVAVLFGDKMPPAKTFKCGSCSLAIGKSQGSIQCRICKIWFHTTCSDISEKEFKILSDSRSMAYLCSSCDGGSADNVDTGDEMRNLNGKLDSFISKHQSDQRELNKKLDEFMKKNEEDKLALQTAFVDAVAEIKVEMGACISKMKNDIIDCSKLIDHVDKSATAKVTALQTENNVLHRRLNRGDIVISGLPEGLTNLIDPVVALGGLYNVPVSVGDINHVCYMHNRKQMLVKFNCVMTRDTIMREYFKTRSLKLSDLLPDPNAGGDLESRVYLNDHYSPSASHLNGICRKLLRNKSISRFKILNNDKLAAKLILLDGKEVIYDVTDCAALLNHVSVVPS